MYVSQGLVEQHIHGCFGIDFMNCSEAELLDAAYELAKCGVCAFFPTVMTDSLKKIKERIQIIKNAANKTCDKSAVIAGIHLEGPFINPEKAGIHQIEYIQKPDINIFQEIEDDFIKIVTVAPELDDKGKFIKYLQSKDIKISLGHSTGNNFQRINQITHLYNAMGTFHHRNKSTVVNALLDENIYTELIADLKHVSEEVIKLTFKIRPLNKILLISDALPLAHSDKKEGIFAGQTIYNKDGNLINKDGTMAGSSMLLCDIIQNLVSKKFVSIKDAVKMGSDNQLKYHNLQNHLKLTWSNKGKIEMIEFIRTD